MFSPVMSVFDARVALHRGPKGISVAKVWVPREVAPEDKGIVADKEIAAPDAEAKRSRPKKDARAPEMRLEQAWEGQN